METTYTMIGVDGLQYGPITLDQLKGWIGEGRVTTDTKILRSDTTAWLPASNYGELGLASSAPAAFASRPAVTAGDPALLRRVRLGARWFLWIAGLSLVNTFMAASGKGFVFLIGLGVTQVIDGLAAKMGSNAMIGVGFNVIVASIFALFGVFAWRRQSWSFVVGMIFYALDALIFLATSSWIGLAFHVFVLYWLFMGLKANNQLKAQGI